MARIYDPRRAQIYLRLGIPTVATVSWTIDQVLRRLLPDLLDEWSDPTGRLSLTERELPDALGGPAPARARPSPARSASSPSPAPACARLDFADLVGQEGDVLHLAVFDDAGEVLEARLSQAGDHRPGPRGRAAGLTT